METSLTRLLFLILILSSCASLLKDESLNKFRTFLNPAYTVAETEVPEFSYFILNYKNQDITFVLSSIDEQGIETWIGPHLEKMKTYKGLIIFTNGLENDYLINKLDLIYDSLHKSDISFDISLSNPPLISLPVNYQLLSAIPFKKECSKLISYKRVIPELRKSYKDTFCFDSNDKVSSSTQSFDPLYDKVRITFNYIY